MNTNELEKLYDSIDKQNFISNAHTRQNRMFGFVTTNIRNAGSIVKYIKELVTIYQKYKSDNDLVGWSDYIRNNQSIHKQKIKRLEIAKILFRNVKDSPFLNDNAEKLFEISKNGDEYLELFLCFYLLSGKYFDVEKQPLVAIEKIQTTYKGDLLKDCLDVLNNNKLNRIFFATLFFNDDCENILYYLLENDCDVSFFEKDNYKKRKINNAGGIKNFKYDIFIIANYLIFKKACEKNYDYANIQTSLYKIINDYVDDFFDLQLNKFIKVESKLTKEIFSKNTNLIVDIISYALNIQDEEEILLNKRRKHSIKIESVKKYNYRCFIDWCECDSNIHQQTYFKKRDGTIYLEGHHLIQMENSKLFKNSLDVLENIIPLCPNCHRKIHNAEEKDVVNMLKTIYKKIDKKQFIKQGIFVDINTLGSFYGIEEDIE
ncbi:MAG: HNH endonuclease [Prevotellaceae bacterium]|jgi:5-methylcytosine-specific restriction endonuclease McrA|nr:HNH endonuclease [Prevotellaceae bacterium]